MTPTETARAALQKALEALPDPPKSPVGDGFTRGAVIRLIQPARLAIAHALAALQAEEPTASMDEKALEIANRLMAATVQDIPIARYKATIQVAILEAMQWARSKDI